MAETGRYRSINRQKLAAEHLERELGGGLRRLVFEGYRRLLMARSASAAFNPYGAQTILDLHPAVLAVERRHAGETLLCLTNVSYQPATVTLLYTGRDVLTENLIPHTLYCIPRHGLVWLKRADAASSHPRNLSYT